MQTNKNFSIVLLQLDNTPDKERNIKNAITEIRKAVKKYNPKIVALPECFNSTYGVENFDENAELIPTGHTSTILSNIAKELKIYLIGGTIPERDSVDSNKLYNTATVWSPTGQLIAKHRKVHLYDINLTGLHSFSESSVLTPGDQVTTFEIEGVKFGVIICFDVYYDEFTKAYRNQGVDMIFCPSAFNPYIGPMHWELLNRARATDNQIFWATISPARDATADYVAWGYSMFVDPWGRVLEKAGEDQQVLHYNVDFSDVQKMRDQIPISVNRRPDVYDAYSKNKILF